MGILGSYGYMLCSHYHVLFTGIHHKTMTSKRLRYERQYLANSFIIFDTTVNGLRTQYNIII